MCHRHRARHAPLALRGGEDSINRAFTVQAPGASHLHGTSATRTTAGLRQM